MHSLAQNMEVAGVLREIADLMELKGEDYFKIRAYRRAAREVAGLTEPVADLYKHDRLKHVRGLGKNIMAKITELLVTGKCSRHQELRQEIPPGLLEVMALPGLGPKRARFFHEQLRITSLSELEEAARGRRVRTLPGMGAKREQEILRSIEMVRSNTGRVMLGVARELANELVAFLSSLPGVISISITGKIRRWQEVVDSINLVAAATNAHPVLGALLNHPRVKETLLQEFDRVRVMTWWGVPVDLVVVTEDEYWPALHWSTGSQEHYRRLQMLAWQKGLKLDRHGLFKRGDLKQPLMVTSEHDIYTHLGMSYVPPEIRENNGEVGAALHGEIPSLVDLAGIKGDLHVHSQWSDGISSIEELARRARQKGYAYIAITDHSRSLKVARGLSLEQLLEQHRHIEELNKQMDDFRILTGIEVDILSRGDLDYPDEILSRVDLVIASVHSAFRQDTEAMTGRIIAAIENQHVDIIGHLTGRLLGQRDAYAVDVERVLEAAARHGKILEINASPDRLDLNEYHARMARDCGVKLAINTDAHDTRRLEEMVYGVAVARRAWLEPQDVVNTLDLPELLDLLGQNQRGRG